MIEVILYAILGALLWTVVLTLWFDMRRLSTLIRFHMLEKWDWVQHTHNFCPVCGLLVRWLDLERAYNDKS